MRCGLVVCVWVWCERFWREGRRSGGAKRSGLVWFGEEPFLGNGVGEGFGLLPGRASGSGGRWRAERIWCERFLELVEVFGRSNTGTGTRAQEVADSSSWFVDSFAAIRFWEVWKLVEVGEVEEGLETQIEALRQMKQSGGFLELDLDQLKGQREWQDRNEKDGEEKYGKEKFEGEVERFWFGLRKGPEIV